MTTNAQPVYGAFAKLKDYELYPAADQPQIPSHLDDPCTKSWAGYFMFDPGTERGDMTIEVGADDNAYLSLAQFPGTPVNVNPNPSDPNGGGTYRTTSHTFEDVEAGYYFVNITYVNVGGVRENLSQLTVMVNGAEMVIGELAEYPEEVDPTLTPLTADEYGEIAATGTDCHGYIKAGDPLVDGHHTIHIGLEYSGDYPDANFDGTPKRGKNTDIEFEPSSVSLQQDGTARFKAKSIKNTAESSEVTLNGAKTDVKFLPAVFEKEFEITIYYTCREKNFTGDSDKNVVCYVGDSNTKTVVIPSIIHSFREQVAEEGFGELLTPVVYDGQTYPYLAKIDSKWRIYQHVLGNHDNILEDKVSCAVDESVIPLGSRIKILFGDKELAAFGNDTFEACDVGDKDFIKGYHIDLYWGTDDPTPGSPSTPATYPKDTLKDGSNYRVILLSE